MRTFLRTTFAAAVLFASACGDDDAAERKPEGGIARSDGGSDATVDASPGPQDANVVLPMDSATSDSAVGDSGDSSAMSDARVDGAVPAADAADALAQALLTAGIRADQQRMELVLSAYCANFVRCDPDAGVPEAECLADVMEGYRDAVTDGFSTECLDALLDRGSCLATVTCERESDCDVWEMAESRACPPEDAGAATN